MELFEEALLPPEIKTDHRLKTWEMQLAADIYGTSELQAQDGYRRGAVTAGLISYFLSEIKVRLNETCPALSVVSLNEEARKLVELLKEFVFLKLTSAPELRLDRFRATKTIRDIFDALLAKGEDLLPLDFQRLLERSPGDPKHRIICDFVSGMTDRYASELHTRLFVESTAFKPV
jgi:dGTPase